MYLLRLITFQLLLIVSTAGIVWAQGHEIVFIVDQSGSMHRGHGPNNSWAANDALGHRADIVLHGYDTIRQYLDDHRQTGVTHRIHVIEFGDTVLRRSDLDVSLLYDPAIAAGQNRQERAKLESFQARDMGNTNTKAALDEAVALIRTFSGVPRDRVHVVLVTDGRPAVPGTATERGSVYQQGLEAASQELARLATLDVVGIIGQENRDEYWTEWGPYWKKVSSDHAFPGKTAPELAEIVNRVVRDRLGLPALQLASNPYFCPPYLRAVTFTVFKSQRGGQARIKDALGRVITPATPNVTFITERTYDQITIEDPAPGLWEIDQLAAKTLVDPLYQQIVREDPKTAAAVRVPFTLGYRVLSNQGREFQELPQYPVGAAVKLTDPNGVETRVAMRHEGRGRFTATTPHTLTAAGTATLAFEGTTTLPNGSQHTVFALTEPLGATNKRLLVLAAGESLPAAAALRAGRTQVIPSMRLLQDPGGGPIDIRAVSNAPGKLVQFRLTDLDGTPMTGWTAVAPGSSGTLDASADVRYPLLSLDWLLRRPRAVFAEVRVDDQSLVSDYAVRALVRDGADAEFDRNAALPAMLANPLAVVMVFREWLVTYVTVLIAIALVALCGSYVGYRYLRKLGYYVSDNWILGQRVIVSFQRPFATEEEQVKRSLTGDYLRGYRRRAKGAITVGEGTDAWKPESMKIKRLFRPWLPPTVKLVYPVVDKSSKKRRYMRMTITESNVPAKLDGVDRVQVQVRVRRRGEPAASAV